MRHARVRRRFPFMGLVPLAYGVLVPPMCAGLSLLLKVVRAVPQQLGAPRAAAPSLENVIFGFGFTELLVAWAFVGFLLWRCLWNIRMPVETQQLGVPGVLGGLLKSGAILGPFLALLFLPLATWGLATRGMETVPLLARPFLAVLAAPVISISALANPAILVSTLVLGIVVGVLTAPAVAFLWQRYPEEPILKG